MGSNTSEFDLIVKILLDGTCTVDKLFKQVAEKYIAFFKTIVRPMLHEDASANDEAVKEKYRSEMERYEAAEELAMLCQDYLDTLKH